MKLTLDESCRFGMGVDSRMQQARGEAIAFDGVTDAQGGQNVTGNFTLITQQEQLTEALEISVSASIRYGLAQVSARMKFAEDYACNEASVYLLLHAQAENAPRHMTGARLTPTAEKAYRRAPEEFRRNFGDTYIDEIYSGGSLAILYIFHTRDESSRREISGSLQASIGNFMAGGDISGSFKSTVEQATIRSELEIKAFISGGRGVVLPSSLDESVSLYRNFAVTVLNAGVPYRVTVKPWNEFPLPPGPTWAETLARQDTIDTCGKNILAAIQQRSRIQYILDEPEQFIDPDLAELRNAQGKLNALIGKWAQTAGACNEDISKCSLQGLELPAVPWPNRLETHDVLGAKIEEVRLHDSRAAVYFRPENFPGGRLDQVYDVDPNRAGRWRISYDSEGRPIGGVFWCEGWGAHVVYGAIFRRYARFGHCQGPYSYPREDEETYNRPDSPNSRVQYFEGGTLWWDARDNHVVGGPYTPIDEQEPPLPPGPI
ncbi:hypothetical protein NFX46_20075 [Streptomyces phaeoluteigriseus]|uniref:Uncharacterized protein n=1 Tax=Streptomyces phaeoluteigriseus TaxID=114686 RepID=A0ABY4ZA61_9ACTN|nr:hypothetical protein [Streptomyces phaeoluteigriseus]USQ85840.1 hypothetical protein NFX46_20075 [Streptomyces phaeoluteigriseus]